MKIVAVTLLLVGFAIISDASANDDSILTPSGQYIPGKLEYQGFYIQFGFSSNFFLI